MVAVMFEPGQANGALSQAWQVLPAKAGRSMPSRNPSRQSNCCPPSTTTTASAGP